MNEKYISAVIDCWKCNKKTTVYTWPGQEAWQENPPPDPKPATLKFIYSSTYGSKYWANVCQHCGRVQGDYFLYYDPDGPFWGLHGGVFPVVVSGDD
jgi:hypothetical protein